MDVSSSLIDGLGLSPTEAKIYVAGLPHAAVGVRELVKRTGVKRPTAYHALETLLQKGLASKSAAAGRVTFSMTAPERFGSLIDRQIGALENKKRSLASVLPHLASLRAAGTGEGARVSHYEGIDGIKTVVDEALYCRSGRWDIIAPRRNFFSEFDHAYADYFMGTRRQRNIVARSLWERTPNAGGKPGRMLSADDLRLRQPRYLPDVMRGKFQSVVIVFDDAVALISSYKNLSAVLIRSKEINAMMAAMFEGLWSAAEPYRRG